MFNFIFLLFLLVFSQQILAVSPIPDISLNHKQEPAVFTRGQTNTINLSLVTDDSTNLNADWWIYADTSFGQYYYDVTDGWKPGLKNSYQGNLFTVDSFILYKGVLPEGIYQLNFAVDTNPNGILDLDSVVMDTIRLEVNVQESISGRVIDLDGKPISGALVTSQYGNGTTDGKGWFNITAHKNAQWVTVTHENYLSRTRAASPHKAVLFRLTANNGETISLQFGGDTMMGRRFFDKNGDGDLDDALLSIEPSVAEHNEIISYIKPLLENADLSILNLENPLSELAYYDLSLPLPEHFHPNKSYSFATHPNAAKAFKESGIDIFGLANNHMYDLLEDGITTTIATLQNIGIDYVGAGLNETEAWQPLVKEIKGQTIAFIACTQIGGINDQPSYIASDEEGKGGAAYCRDSKIRDTVTEAKAKYDTVVMMIHGGKEYNHYYTNNVLEDSSVARESGADIIINHTPHVIGGFDWDNDSVVAWSLGNFMFDQRFWETFQSFLFTVHIRKGEIIRAYVEPLLIEDYITKGITRDFADFLVREAAGRYLGDFVMEDGAMEIDISGRSVPEKLEIPFQENHAPGKIISLSSGFWLSGYEGAGTVRLGRDLLWTGTFETNTVDENSSGGALWYLDGVDKFIGEDYAHSGKRGVRLFRDHKNSTNVSLRTIDRLALPEGTDTVTITGWLKGNGDTLGVLQLYWYDSRSGSNIANEKYDLEYKTSGDWTNFRIDVNVRENATGLRPYFRLYPPEQGEATVDFDDLKVIAWSSSETEYSPLYDNLWLKGDGTLTLRYDVLPGAEDWYSKTSLLK